MVGVPTHQGTLNDAGYGRVWWASKLYYAHRLAYLAKHGSLLAQTHVCHHCDRPACINIDHLFAGSAADNHVDKARKGRSARNRGEKAGTHKLTESEIRIIWTQLPHQSDAEIAANYGVVYQTIYAIRTGRTWAWLTKTL